MSEQHPDAVKKLRSQYQSTNVQKVTDALSAVGTADLGVLPGVKDQTTQRLLAWDVKNVFELELVALGVILPLLDSQSPMSEVLDVLKDMLLTLGVSAPHSGKLAAILIGRILLRLFPKLYSLNELLP